MTERLEIIYGHLDNCTRFADIGCDHGYITKAMLDGKKCHYAVASDVSNKCLDKAKALLKDYEKDKKAECLLSDGFDNLPNFFDEALISGMGGEEIVSTLMKQHVIEVQPLTYIRGITIDDSIVLCDEFQNVSLDTFKSMITRIGENSRYVVMGDVQ
jgi:hypothetical protein